MINPLHLYLCSVVSAALLYLELLCQLATETIKHGQVEGTKVRIEAGRREKRRVVSSWLFM